MTLRWAVAVSWIALVVTASVLPGEAFEPPSFPGADKIAHLLMYGIMAALMHHAVRRPCLTCGALVTALCGLIGGLMECAQLAVPGRFASLADAFANVLGAAAASAVYVVLLRRRRASPGE